MHHYVHVYFIRLYRHSSVEVDSDHWLFPIFLLHVWAHRSYSMISNWDQSFTYPIQSFRWSYLRRSIRHFPNIREMLSQSSTCSVCGEAFLNTWLECVQFIDAHKVSSFVNATVICNLSLLVCKHWNEEWCEIFHLIYLQILKTSNVTGTVPIRALLCSYKCFNQPEHDYYGVAFPWSFHPDHNGLESMNCAWMDGIRSLQILFRLWCCFCSVFGWHHLWSGVSVLDWHCPLDLWIFKQKMCMQMMCGWLCLFVIHILLKISIFLLSPVDMKLW